MEFLPSQLEDWLGASSGHLAEKCLPEHLDCSIGNRITGHSLGTPLTPATHACTNGPSYLMELLDPRHVGASLLENKH